MEGVAGLAGGQDRPWRSNAPFRRGIPAWRTLCRQVLAALHDSAARRAPPQPSTAPPLRPRGVISSAAVSLRASQPKRPTAGETPNRHPSPPDVERVPPATRRWRLRPSRRTIPALASFTSVQGGSRRKPNRSEHFSPTSSNRRDPRSDTAPWRQNSRPLFPMHIVATRRAAVQTG